MPKFRSSQDKLGYTLSTVGTLRDCSGVMVSQSQKIPSDYRTYEKTSEILRKFKKKVCLVGLFESIFISLIISQM